MRRSDFLLKVITAIVFFAVLIYIGYYLYDLWVNPLTTVPAAPAATSESVSAEGRIVREEHLLTGGGVGTYITASNGDKISKGGSVAVVYSNQSAIERSEQINEAKQKLAALTDMLGGKTIPEITAETVNDLAHAVRGGDFSKISEIATRADTYIFGDEITYSSEQLKSEIASLESQLNSLESQSSSDTKKITAGEAGIFSSVVDGYEHITPDMLDSLTRSDYIELFKTSQAVPADTVGKIVTGADWYFVTEVPSNIAVKLAENRSFTVRFYKTYSADVKMTLEHLGEDENGYRTAVFSSNRYVHDVASLRDMYADIVFADYEGLKVPKDAMRIDESGRTYVFVVAGIRADSAYVDIISETDDFYIVQPENGERLAEGTEIIVTTGDIFDGKVIA